MAKTANEEILDATVRHQIKLLRFSAGEAQRIAELLAASDAELVSMLEAGLTDTSEAHIKSILSDIRILREGVAAEIQSTLQGDLDELATTEAVWEGAMLSSATPVVIAFSSVPPVVLKAVAGSPINGIPLEGWLGKMSTNDISRIEQQIRLGFLAGETIPQMIARIRGTKANNYKDGVTDITRREAEMIARTAVNHVSTAARQATWEANADVISGVRWVATLDGRTSPVCQSRDGVVYPIDKGPRPPAHPNCRSTVAPVLYGEEIVGERATVTDTRTRKQQEKDFRAEAKAEAGDDWKTMSVAERNAAVKAKRKAWADANIGHTPSSTNYEKWLRGQSADFQNDVLGKGKAELFRQGLPLDKFVDETGKPYTLAQLQAELGADKLNVLQPGVGLKAKSMLQQGMTPQEVLAQIKTEFPDANTSTASIAYYKSELKKAGMLDLPKEGLVTGGLKKVLSVADIVSQFESNMPEGVKHAIGGQWMTVVDDLAGAPGAYGYYQAGKGVLLNASKLSAVPAVQAQQIISHELGHLLHKQHDALLPDESIAALKTAVKLLTPEEKKLYAYYLTDIDELTAEVYAQALSPSPLTSQGLTALSFNKVFGEAIAAAKETLSNKFPKPSPQAAVPLPGGPVLPFEVAGKHSTVGSLSKALLQQGMPDADVLKAVLAEFPDAKTKIASIQSYKSELKKKGLLPNKSAGPVIVPKVENPVPAPALEAAKIDPALAAPKVSSAALTSSQLKQEAIKLFESGVLENKAIIEALSAQYPNSAHLLKLNNVATWKTLWKKNTKPKNLAKAEQVSAAATTKAAEAAPLKKPKLLDAPMGSMSQNVLAKVKDSLMAGGTTADAYKIMEKMFGSIKEPGASDLLELAQYQIAGAKQAAKPYMAATAPKPEAFKFNASMESFKNTLNTKGKAALEIYMKGLQQNKTLTAIKSEVSAKAGVTLSAANHKKLIDLAEYELSKGTAAAAKKPFKLDKYQEDYYNVLDTDGKDALEIFKQAHLKNMTGEQALELVHQIKGHSMFGDYHPGKMMELAEYMIAKEGGVVTKSAAAEEAANAIKLSKADVDMTPARAATKPSEGFPPPPRFTEVQRQKGIMKYAKKLDISQLNKMNTAQHNLGLEKLTEAESAAIRAYTKGTYKALNNNLRASKYSSDNHLQAFVEAAQSGMSKMPKYKGLSSRGITLDSHGLKNMLSTYRKGAIVEDSAFISTSRGDNAAFSGNVYLKVQGKSGVGISSYSYYPGEREVLFMPGTRFRVDDVIQENGRYIISITEI